MRVIRAATAVISFLLAAPVGAQVQTAVTQLGGREQASVEHCERIKAEKGSAFKEGDCKTFFEQLDNDKPGWRYWALGMLAFALVAPTMFNMVKRRKRAE